MPNVSRHKLAARAWTVLCDRTVLWPMSSEFIHRSILGRTATTVALQAKATRSRKKTTVKLQDLPQGMIALAPFDDEGVKTPLAEGYPTVVQQARNNMRKFDHCVVLTRVGNFYELYFDQATEYGPLLNIKVGSKKTNAGAVPMAGFPFFQLDRFLKILVQEHGKHVAISEETANDPSQKVKSGGLLFDRQVKRIVTPGTLIDEHFLSPYEHNFLLAINVQGDLDMPNPASSSIPLTENISIDAAKVGLAWLDLSSGDFCTQSTDLSALSSSIARINPREIILDQALQTIRGSRLSSILDEDGHLITYYNPADVSMSVHDWAPMLEDAGMPPDAQSFTREEVLSANILLQYVKTQVPGIQLRLQAPTRRQVESQMNIDKNSLRGLEVMQTMRDGLYKGSLLQAVRRTSTESGARLLAQRLISPSRSLDIVNGRLDVVEEFLCHKTLREEVVSLLRQTHDSLRLVQKFSFARGEADDLLGLAATIRVTEQIVQLLNAHMDQKASCLKYLVERFQLEGPNSLAVRIVNAIDQDGLIMRQRTEDAEAAQVVGLARSVIEDESEPQDLETLQKSLSSKRYKNSSELGEDKSSEEDIWIMRRDASPTLKDLHQTLDRLREEKSMLTTELRDELSASSLTLKLTPGLGHICHVKGKDAKTNIGELDDVKVVSSTKSTCSFYIPRWSNLGRRIEDAKLRIRGEEVNIFRSLRDEVIQNLVLLRRNAAVLDELDVACSFARLAEEHDLKRPQLDHSGNLNIWGGRHMMVEKGLAESGRQFMPNNCILGNAERIWLITGPNMAGKSTFLRQSALISILAQTGSFVPADYAEIGMVDQIFSRVGSADNLSQDQSTFMVEMLETAHILRHATERSFVIMDEVGRGTTPEDGIAVGYAVLYHLQHINKCRALFATHFHALCDMTKDFEGLACYCTNVVEEANGAFRYDHRLRKGVNRQSHALKVARLAGLPDKAISIASDVLKVLNQGVEFNQLSIANEGDPAPIRRAIAAHG